MDAQMEVTSRVGPKNILQTRSEVTDHLFYKLTHNMNYDHTITETLK